ncbi:hypothetical protein EVAR_44482_1 [Eumeta japonica]|uniref:Uncharacterized protein n=1 Tax=Eumeta variegata TaxID=151549 RepID=A0A4C1WN05_EUMVA|nr:hypothetical protein EVAR_44482_1 [Eumeta japonica]
MLQSGSKSKELFKRYRSWRRRDRVPELVFKVRSNVFGGRRRPPGGGRYLIIINNVINKGGARGGGGGVTARRPHGASRHPLGEHGAGAARPAGDLLCDV